MLEQLREVIECIDIVELAGVDIRLMCRYLCFRLGSLVAS
jgi:hypothetical protein